MFKKHLFLSITLGIFAVLTATLLPPTNANAWAPTASVPWTGDLEARLDSALAGSSVADWRNLNYATANYDGSSFLFFVWGDSGSGISGGISDNGTGSTAISGRFCRWYYDVGTSPGCNPLSSSYSLTTDTVYSLHLTETYRTANPGVVSQYADLLAGSGVPDPANDVKPRCQTWDVACWFTSTVGSIVDGFQSLADFFGEIIKSLGEWIANLIMPANADGSFDNRFTDFFTNVQETMTKRLGFLLFPFQFVADLFDSFQTIWNPGGIEGCTSGVRIGVPNLLGTNAVTFDMCKIEDTPIWTPAVTLLRFVWIVGVVGFLHKKYFSVVRG